MEGWMEGGIEVITTHVQGRGYSFGPPVSPLQSCVVITLQHHHLFLRKNSIVLLSELS